MQFWRVTVDNLEFKMAFAKKIFSGGYQKRMLHLLTGQVSHHSPPAEPCPTACPLASCEASRLPESLQELDFLDLTISERVHYCKFASTVLSVIGTADRLFCKPSECSQSLLQVLWTRLESFTPAESDVIKYATVREAYSGRPEDVASYLIELKKDLCIDQEGFPSYVVVGGGGPAALCYHEESKT